MVAVESECERGEERGYDNEVEREEMKRDSRENRPLNTSDGRDVKELE